jgi:hypothetical protein
MKTLTLLFILAALFPTKGLARAVLSYDMKTLMCRSSLVLVGKVKSVQPSGIKEKIVYPTKDYLVFEWLKVEIEVIEPVKGAQKGDVIRTLMLSMPEGVMANAPGMIHPKPGQHHLLFLIPTQFKNVYAAATAPDDEDEAIFILDRTNTMKYGSFGDGNSPEEYGERYKAIWSLVDDMGLITPKGAEELRKNYQAEIATKPPKDAVIHLQWKKETSVSEWQWNAPIEGSEKKKPTGTVKSAPVKSK